MDLSIKSDLLSSADDLADLLAFSSMIVARVVRAVKNRALSANTIVPSAQKLFILILLIKLKCQSLFKARGVRNPGGYSLYSDDRDDRRIF